MYTLIRKPFLFILFALLLIASCASGPSSEGGGKTASGAEPAWVKNPRTAFPENQYVSAVGFAENRENAEKNALQALIQIFGQSITGDTTVSSRYSQALKGGMIESSEDSAIDRSITTSVEMGTVVGAEIKDVWTEGPRSVYAVAVMEKMKAMMIYSDLIDKNNAAITRLTDIPLAERSTLDAYARYDMAVEIADTNAKFLNLLSVINPAMASSKRASVLSSDQFKIEKLRIAQTIPIAVTVDGDPSGRVKAAFTAAITAAGFKTGGNDSRYQLTAQYSVSEAALPNQTNKFARYAVDARLRDGLTNTELLPYSITGREGHLNYSEAEQRALRIAEQKIREDFGMKFSAFLSNMGSVK